MTILILLLSVGIGMIVGDCKEFYFKDGGKNELAFILFKMMFTFLFIEVNAFLLLLNFYFKRYEKALASTPKEKIKIENHTRETVFLPAEIENEEETIDPDLISEQKPKSKSRGRSTKKLIK
jgi:hypothetical protein